MTPVFGDSHDMTELTSCLSQSIVMVLRMKPPDPIDFIAHSLLSYRRLHPHRSQGSEIKENVTEQDNPVVSSNLFQVNVPKEEMTNLTKTSSISPIVKPIIVERTDKEDLHTVLEENFPHIGFVHQYDTVNIGMIGDLFDEDDFG